MSILTNRVSKVFLALLFFGITVVNLTLIINNGGYNISIPSMEIQENGSALPTPIEAGDSEAVIQYRDSLGELLVDYNISFDKIAIFVSILPENLSIMYNEELKIAVFVHSLVLLEIGNEILLLEPPENLAEGHRNLVNGVLEINTAVKYLNMGLDNSDLEYLSVGASHLAKGYEYLNIAYSNIMETKKQTI